MEDAENKTYENEIDKSSKEEPKTSNYGGKREGAGRPINNPISSPERKMYAAEKAAPFVHPRLASTTSRIGSDEPIEIKVQWQKD